MRRFIVVDFVGLHAQSGGSVFLLLCGAHVVGVPYLTTSKTFMLFAIVLELLQRQLVRTLVGALVLLLCISSVLAIVVLLSMDFFTSLEEKILWASIK